MTVTTPQLNRLLRYCLYIILILGLAFAGSLAYNLQTDSLPLENVRIRYIAYAIFAQVFTAGLTILCWRKNLQLHGLRSISLLDCAGQVGLNCIGKYLPGKILGSAARVAAINLKTGAIKPALSASILEQTALLHSGAVLIAILLMEEYVGRIAAATALVASVLSVGVIRYLSALIRWALSIIRPSVDLESVITEMGDVKRYAIIFSYLCIIWITSALALSFCLNALGLEMGFAKVVLIVTSAYLGGFLALFSPGGLGVRDGILVALLSPAFGLSAALSISIFHRIITLTTDVLTALFSIVLIKKSPEEK